MVTDKGVKIQSILSGDEYEKFRQILSLYSVVKGKRISESQYIRDIISDHNKLYDGEDIKLINEKTKKMYKELCQK